MWNLHGGKIMLALAFCVPLLYECSQSSSKAPPIPTLQEINATADAYCRSVAGGSYYEYTACRTGGVTARQDYRN